jgi:hypothetical protein
MAVVALRKASIIILLVLFSYSAFAQNFISFVDGHVVKADKTKITTDFVSFSVGNTEFEHPINEIAFILQGENDKIIYINYDEIEKRVSSPQFDTNAPVSSIKRGMSVFVKYGHEELRARLCAIHVIEYLNNDNAFNVVYTPVEAHFIFEVIFDERGSDKIYFFIKNKDTNQTIYSSRRVKAWGGIDPYWETKAFVEKLMKEEFLWFKKKIKEQ